MPAGPGRIATDEATGKMYWTNWNVDIERANLDGSNIEVVVAVRLARGIAIDPAAHIMYWTNRLPGRIQRAHLDGADVEDLVTFDGWPIGIALDPVDGKVYWTQTGPNRVRRADLDGSNVEDVATVLHAVTTGVAVDIVRRQVYWANSLGIHRASLDGSNPEDIQGPRCCPKDIAIDPFAGKVYWTDATNDVVQRANLDGSNVEVLAETGPGILDGIALTLLGTGACCLPDDSCDTTTAVSCAQNSGIFAEGPVCSAAQACCLADDTCQSLDPICCVARGGIVPVGTGPGVHKICEGDNDSDGVDGACGDLCPDDPNKVAPGECGCGNSDVDTDADGVEDCHDGCPSDPNKTSPGVCGCGVSDNDTDGDTVADCNDNCPDRPNTDQADRDGDGVGNACEATVPAVSDWGIVIIALLVLSLAKVRFGRRYVAA